jgi:hypothetical protein
MQKTIPENSEIIKKVLDFLVVTQRACNLLEFGYNIQFTQRIKDESYQIMTMSLKFLLHILLGELWPFLWANHAS